MELDDFETMLASECIINNLFVNEINLSGTYCTDGVAHLPTRSHYGTYYLVVSVFNNYVHIEPSPDRTGPSLLKAHKATLEFFTQRGHRPKVHRMDNEVSTALKAFMATNNLEVQMVPLHNHRANRAERAIRDVKNQLISIFCTCHPNFPVNLWGDLVPQAEITLNTLGTSWPSWILPRSDLPSTTIAATTFCDQDRPQPRVRLSGMVPRTFSHAQLERYGAADHRRHCAHQYFCLPQQE